MFIRKEIPGVREDRVKGVLHRMMIEETRLLLPRGGMGVLEYRERGSEEVIAIRPVEISDTRAPYLTRTARVPRRPVGFWNAPLKEGEEEERKEEQLGEERMEGETGEKGLAKPVLKKPIESGPPFIKFLEEFALALREMNRDDVVFSFIKSREAQKENFKPEILGRILSVFRNEITGESIRDSVWISTLAENLIYDNVSASARYPYMADPVLRREYLIQIAKGSLDGDETILADTGFTVRDIIQQLNSAYTSSGEIIPATRRNPMAKIITMNTEGLIETVSADGEVISTGDVSKPIIGQGLHGYRSRQIQASRVARYLPPGILRFFIQDMIRKEDIKESVKGRMCDDKYGLGTIGKRLEKTFYEYMEASHPDIEIGEDLRDIQNLFTSTSYTHIVCIFVEIITRATDSYRPPHLSGMRIR